MECLGGDGTATLYTQTININTIVTLLFQLQYNFKTKSLGIF